MATADVESIADDGKVPAEARPEPEVNKLFRMVMKHEGSDLHMKVGLPPMMRLRGIIRQMEMKPLSEQEMERLLYPIISEHHRKIMEETGGAHFAHIMGEDEWRFRVNGFKQRGDLSVGAGRNVLASGAQGPGPRRPGRDLGGRNARSSDLRGGPKRGRARPPRVWHSTRLERAEYCRPRPRSLSRRLARGHAAKPRVQPQ